MDISALGEFAMFVSAISGFYWAESNYQARRNTMHTYNVEIDDKYHGWTRKTPQILEIGDYTEIMMYNDMGDVVWMDGIVTHIEEEGE